jgi:hypothetical protein
MLPFRNQPSQAQALTEPERFLPSHFRLNDMHGLQGPCQHLLLTRFYKMKVNIPQAMVVILILVTLVYTDELESNVKPVDSGKREVLTTERDTVQEGIQVSVYLGTDSIKGM